MSAAVKRLGRAFRGSVERGVELAPYTTYRIGGPADLALSPVDAADLARAVQALQAAGVPWVMLGGGSNVLVSDRGVRGAVVLTRNLTRLEVQGTELWAGAGVVSHQVALAALEAGLTGAEFLAHLPGSFGGACLMNAKAHGGEISVVLRRALVVTARGELARSDLRPEEFAYKRSPFAERGQVVAEACLGLAAGERSAIEARVREIELARRKNHELDFPSCGCVFKNDHRLGVPSGLLIDRCGLKGYRVGDAQVSPYHANFVINLGRATAADVWQVISHVRETVAHRTGHALELEVKLLGDFAATGGDAAVPG